MPDQALVPRECSDGGHHAVLPHVLHVARDARLAVAVEERIGGDNMEDSASRIDPV